MTWSWRSLFGISLAGMNLAFYSALDRIPLGIAVTFEFVGPLGVAVFGSRRPLDLVWVVVAAAGILLLSDFGGADLDGVGVALALLAGGFWAAYILLSVRVGQGLPGRVGPRARDAGRHRAARADRDRRGRRDPPRRPCSRSASGWE